MICIHICLCMFIKMLSHSLAVIPLSSTIPSCNRSSISYITIKLLINNQSIMIMIELIDRYNIVQTHSFGYNTQLSLHSRQFGERSDSLSLKIGNENIHKSQSFTKSARIKLNYSYHNEIMFRCRNTLV